MSSPPVLTPPLLRCAWRAAEGHGQHVALRGLQHGPLRRHLHVLAQAAVGPLGQGQHGAGGGVGRTAWRKAWGTTVRTGGRSSSPVMASWQPAAITVRSVAGQPAFGPVSPNAVIDTVDERRVGGAQRVEIDGRARPT